MKTGLKKQENIYLKFKKNNMRRKIEKKKKLNLSYVNHLKMKLENFGVSNVNKSIS